MNNQDDQLHRLLQQWREIEPSSNFDAQVWRRLQQTEPPAPAPWWERLWQPAYALAGATALGLLIGLTSGLFSVPAAPPPVTAEVSFLGPDTLAGSQLATIKR